MPSYQVTVWIEAGGEPEDDPRVTAIVGAPDKHRAVEKAREFVRDNRKELNPMKIWAWVVRKL
jgi:hypothetical protein